MGATATVCNAKEDPVDAVRKILDGNLPDIVIECVGHADQQFNLCIDLIKPNGRILFFGVPQQVINGLRWRDLFYKNVTVHTSVNPDFRKEFPLAMQWIGEGRINVAPIITHRYPLSQIQEAFETFRDRKDGAIKVIVDFPAKKAK
jgi:L-iditol 2-dehydrogenase